MMNYCKLILRNNNTLWKCIRGIRQKNVTTPDDVNNENEKLEKLFELDKPFYGEKEEEKKRLDEINFDHIPIEKQVVIFCPGQGAQTVGMLEETKKNNPKALQLFDKASEILGYDLQSVIDKGPASKLNQTIYTQPAIVVSSLVAYENLKLLRPDVEETLTHIAGFSVGEYTAAVISGILSFSDALKIIKVRSEAMHKCCQFTSSKMIVVSTTAKSDLFGLMKGSLKFATEINGVPLCEIANILFVGHKVIGMSNDCYNFFSKYAKDYNVKLIKELAVEGAFHTRLMSEAVPQIKLTMKNVTFQKPFCNMYSNLTGKVMCRKTTYIRESLATQVCNPVKWEQIQQLIYKNHKIVNEKHLFPMYFEIGPGQTLGALWAKISKKAYKNYVHISC